MVSLVIWHYCINRIYIMVQVTIVTLPKVSVPVDFLRPKFRVAHKKHDIISILMKKYTYLNMYIIKMMISCKFILCLDITAFFKLKWKFASYMYSENRENLNGDFLHFAPKDDKHPQDWRIKRMFSIWDYILFRIIWNLIRDCFVFEKPARPHAK